jgi:hypothetical protein
MHRRRTFGSLSGNSGATNARTEGDTPVTKKSTEAVAASSPTWDTLEAFAPTSAARSIATGSGW